MTIVGARLPLAIHFGVRGQRAAARPFWRGGKRRGASLPAALQSVWLLALVGYLLSGLIPARADSTVTAFEAANKLYEEGKFAEAASAYQKLLQSGQVSAALYFNLGNAFFKTSQIGRAITAYRRAGQLNPRDPDVRANLQFARKQTQGPTLVASRWQQWLGKLSLNEWAELTASGIWLCFLLLGLVQLRPGLKGGLRGFIIALALATLLSSACLGAAWAETRQNPVAIVVKQNVPVRHGPLEESTIAFTAHDGAELVVLDRKDEWLEVRTDPRRIGWLRRDQVLLPSE